MLKNKLLKNSSILFIGTLSAFAFSFLFNAYFRRVLSDEIFATYEVVLRLASILAVVFSARYGVAIVIPEKEESSRSLFWGANIIALGFFIVSFLVVYFFNGYLANTLGLTDSKYLYFVPFISLIMTWNQNINFLFTRLKKFKEQSFFKIFHRLGEGSVNYSMLSYLNNGLLAIGDLIGRSSILIFGLFRLRKNDSWVYSFKSNEIKQELIRYKDYPLYNALPALLNTVSAMLPILLISKKYGVFLTSKIGLSFQVLAIPLALLTTSISQVIMQRVSQDKNENKKIGGDVLQVLLFLSISSVLGVFIIFLFGPDIFSLIFGESNHVSGEFAQILVFSIAVKLLVSPFSGILPALDRIKLGSYWQLLYFCLTLTLCLRFGEDIETFLFHLICVDIISYLIYGLLIFKEVYQYNKRL